MNWALNRWNVTRRQVEEEGESYRRVGLFKTCKDAFNIYTFLSPSMREDKSILEAFKTGWSGVTEVMLLDNDE